MTREIVMDTETTGLSPLTGDRVVEIGGVELFNHIPTGKTFHQYINPDRQMTADAYNVHGLSDEFLRDKPRFAEIADNMLAFFGDATLIAHNAPFDVSFLNFELEKVGRPALRNPIIDTVAVARDKHPGARVSLDALCKHYGIDNSRRTLHGALLDSEILAEVYLELIGGRQVTLALVNEPELALPEAGGIVVIRQRPVPLAPRLTESELAAHLALIGTIKDALWGYYAEDAAAA